jgi:hypothetical protein
MSEGNWTATVNPVTTNPPTAQITGRRPSRLEDEVEDEGRMKGG